MDRTSSTSITILILVLALIGMGLGWRARKRRQSHIPRPEEVPAQIGRVLLCVEALYLSTTVADRELDRVAVFGLGFRSTATVTVTESGIILALDAVPEAFIPASRLRGVDRATYTIDRVVEKGGLVRLCWTLGASSGTVAGTNTDTSTDTDTDTDIASVDVDSYLRLAENGRAAEFIDAVSSLITHHQTAEQPTEGSTR